MPSLKETKRRILSVKSTQKITRAMKLVSSAKFVRANYNLLAARPYLFAFEGLLKKIPEDVWQSSPFFQKKQEAKSLLILVTADRGLCGSLNTTLIKKARVFIEEKKQQGVVLDLYLWGKRGRFALQGRQEKILDRQEKIFEKPRYDLVKQQALRIKKEFLKGGYQRIYCLYSCFKTALLQEPSLLELLPMSLGDDFALEHKKKTRDSLYLIEPSAQALLEAMVESRLASLIYQIFLESAASEHAARMAAMDNATSNADGVIRSLTLQYNRARQAAITKELIEITSGAEAL